MRKPLIAFVVILIAALAAIGGWLASNVRQSRAAADAYVDWGKSQKIAPVEFSITVPADTPTDQTIYISGDSSELGSWDAAGVPLHRGADGSYHGTVNLLTGVPHYFKVTRGTWGTVERGANGEDISNHAFTATDGQIVQSTVLTWVDQGKSVPGRVTLTGNFRLHRKFESEILGNSRTIIVYLPPDYYSDSSRRYPVLYMQDGQNLFDASTSFAGVEWRVDESAQDLITRGKIRPVIIVGIYNTPDRTAEFTPFAKTPNGTPGRGDLYGRFIVEELKPMIDRTYRTLPDRADTSIGGASMGGMISLAVASEHPDLFGSVVVLDPWLRDSSHSLLTLWTNSDWMRNMRFYVDMGTAGGVYYPGDTEVQDLDALVSQFHAAGLKRGTDLIAVIIKGGQHNESAWQPRVPDFLKFLYGRK